MPQPAVTFAYDEAEDRILPHMLISVGLKEHSATGQTNHLLTATVRFLTEMPIIEIAAPVARRVPDPDLYDLPLLRFSAPGRETARTRTSR